MQRTIVTITTTVVGALALTLFTACGGDSVAKLPGAVTTDPAVGGLGTNPGGDMGGGDPADMSTECLDFAMAYANALGAMGGASQGADADWQAWIASMQASVPDELKDAVAVWGTAMNDYLVVIEQHQNDPAAPEVVAALEAINTPEVQAASDSISAYFDNGCQI